MTHSRMRLPAGKTISVGGSPLESDAEGCVLVPVEYLAEARRHGLTPAPVAIPTAPTLPESLADGEAPNYAERAARRKATKT